MLISLAIAFTVTPWLALKLLAHAPTRPKAGVGEGFRQDSPAFHYLGKNRRKLLYVISR